MKSMLAFIMGWSLAFCAGTKEPIVGAVAATGALVALLFWMRADRSESKAGAGAQIAEGE